MVAILKYWFSLLQAKLFKHMAQTSYAAGTRPLPMFHGSEESRSFSHLMHLQVFGISNLLGI